MSLPVTIYALVDPRTDEVRYRGASVTVDKRTGGGPVRVRIGA